MESNSEIVRYDLSGDFSKDTAVILGELTRAGGAWEFKALGAGVPGGLLDVCKIFGVDV
jgi:tellurium resistance protein TerD